MNEDILQTQPEIADTDSDLVEALKQLKANSVNKDDYNKLKEDNKKLIDALVNGDQITNVQPQAQRSEEEIKQSILNHKGSDMEIAKDIMELYNLKKEQGENIFISTSHNLSPSELQDAEYNAEAVARCLEDSIEYCEGDPSKFHSYFNSKIAESSRIKR